MSITVLLYNNYLLTSLSGLLRRYLKHHQSNVKKSSNTNKSEIAFLWPTILNCKLHTVIYLAMYLCMTVCSNCHWHILLYEMSVNSWLQVLSADLHDLSCLAHVTFTRSLYFLFIMFNNILANYFSTILCLFLQLVVHLINYQIMISIHYVLC